MASPMNNKITAAQDLEEGEMIEGQQEMLQDNADDVTGEDTDIEDDEDSRSLDNFKEMIKKSKAARLNQEKTTASSATGKKTMSSTKKQATVGGKKSSTTEKR